MVLIKYSIFLIKCKVPVTEKFPRKIKDMLRITLIRLFAFTAINLYKNDLTNFSERSIIKNVLKISKKR